ncbi:MAG TPA: serine--tRNA ligase [Candidatus Poseidoniaceae archaeon]|nr:MAG TPA: serine--tRNA ligase [Candidatus Poseidoniales archaeon]HII37145.1 serine--tRNA ligase [Candidatus Poseidoniaceae archaeon]|tara:strand:+ start:517 stop:1809 length:1293 start_codon:yes stop_codon:yes gene_type:complete
MLDIYLFRENHQIIRADHDKRGLSHDKIDQVIHFDKLWLNLQHQTNQLRQKKNTAAKGISEAKKSGDEAKAQAILSEVASLGVEISDLEQQTQEALAKRDKIRMSVPNILHDQVPAGVDESGNTIHSKFGDKPQFDFVPRTHNELIEMNKWVDLKRAAKISGSRFYFLKGDLARLELALQIYAVDFIRQRGYTLVQPPVMMNRHAYEGVTDLGDFETVMYGVEPDKYYMIATSEHPLTAMYMGETIPEEQLPLRVVGVSPCFRREVGSHGQSDLGIWRVHQFTKVEQIVIAKPEDSWQFHEELLQNCIDLWTDLGLHFEVVNICTGDMGTVAARKYDIEAWLPGAGQYKEVVSCSNCTDYQANRLQIKYGQPGHANQPIVHTLNSTAVATSRALVAIMEQNQLADGRVMIPEVLIPLMGGQEHLEACNWG